MTDASPPVPPGSARAPELWQQLQAAAQVLAAVRAGRSASDALGTVAAGLRPGVQALAYAALRGLGRAEALRTLLAPRKPAPAVDALLCLVLALASTQQAQDYDAHTLVNQAVEAAKRHGSRSLSNSAGFLNACLRRFLRERVDLLAEIDEDPATALVARWNHPRWWIARMQKESPEHWQAVLEANNRQPPMTLRVNIAQGPVDDYLAELQAAGIAARRNGAQGVTLAQPLPVQRIPGFAQGRVSVQDAAAQLAAPLLLDDGPAAQSPGRRLRILDACAAPGGKTAHLLELIAARGLDVELIALDVDAERCQRIDENLRRLGLQARVVAADAGNPAAWRQAGLADDPGFDAILLDAPCTASGIVRRHPDVRWLRRESDISSLAGQQARLLAALWPRLLAGGRLLYCTCSVFRAEGEEQVRAFLAHNKEASSRPAPGHLWPLSAFQSEALTDNAIREHDGFYYALLAKGGG
jgi:16S rRNA (cytosine967-C5)-methyltransferase